MRTNNALLILVLVTYVSGCTNIRSTSQSSDISASANYEASTPSQSGELAIGTSDFLLKGVAYIAMLSLIIPLAN